MSIHALKKPQLTWTGSPMCNNPFMHLLGQDFQRENPFMHWKNDLCRQDLQHKKPLTHWKNHDSPICTSFLNLTCAPFTWGWSTVISHTRNNDNINFKGNYHRKMVEN